MSANNTADAVMWRRFGRDHDKPCRRPDVLTCALWECQWANECRMEEACGAKDDPDPGIEVTFHQEHILGGLRFDPGRYRIARLDRKETSDVPF